MWKDPFVETDRLIDVVIAGAGPTGSALAIDLTRRGLKVRLLERGRQAFGGSRAKGVQPRSLEVLHDLGVLDEIVAGGSLYPKLGVHLGPFTIPWRMFADSDPSDGVPYPNTWLIPQFRIDRALHVRLQELGGAVEFGKELLDFTQNSATVNCRVSTSNGTEEIRARYLVGADGGSSTVRKHLGIEFLGATDEEDRILIVDAEVSGLRRDRWHIWPGARGRFVGACPLPHSDLFQWMIRLSPEELPPSDLNAIVARLQSRIRDPRVRLHGIQWLSVFRPNIRLAENYRRGRVFVAGDAAHVHTPAGAQGLNTGLQDAYNLGWKLAQVLAGAPSGLLDTYEMERQAIAEGVLGLSTRKYQGIAKLDPSALRRGKDEQQLLLTYHGGPLAPPGGERTRTLRVGDRAPDGVLNGVHGKPVRLFDLYRGSHFTAVAFGEQAAQACNRLPWPSSGAALKRVVVGATTASVDAVLTDTLRSFENLYGMTGDTLMLIRPDGYIGHIATQDMLATTGVAARAMTPSGDGRGHTGPRLSPVAKETSQ
jgi:2-polyprenyl-6-methoxyphenol hydroxylase-like FAD-dependent oxidoreductase